MSVPDELVQAAAEALISERLRRGRWFGTEADYCEDLARIAVRAAFAKLPKCATASAARAIDFALEGMEISLPEEAVEAIARTVVVALAREFGGQE